MRSLKTLSLSLLVLSSLGVVACGGSQQKEPEPPPYEIDDEDDFDDGMEMTQEFGGMNESKVTRAFQRLYPELEACMGDAQQRIEFLGGEVAFLVKVNMAGQAEAAHIERSSLGNHETEQCMRDKLSASRWPKPVGGRFGLARNSIIFDPGDDVRPPVEWSDADVAETLDENDEALTACGNGGPYNITAYVDVDGSVISAGVAHTDEAGNETASCLVGAVESITFNSPGSWPAKVSFQR